MKHFVLLLAIARIAVAGSITNAEIVTAPTVALLNEKLSKMTTDYIVISVSEPLPLGNEIAVTVSLGNPPGVSRAQIVCAPSISAINSELSRLVSDYAVVSVSVPVQIPTQLIIPSSKPTAVSTTKQFGVTIITGKP